MDGLSQTGPKAYIHLDRLNHNFSEIKNRADNCSLMCIVKTDAYGHGGVLVSKTLEGAGCQWFGVFTHEEGIELRNAGVNQNIFVLCKLNKEALEAAVEYKFSLNLSSWEDFGLLEQFYRKNQILPKVHLKIDTGMTRLGFDFKDTESVLEKILEFRPLDCEGIYSHFATADEGELTYAHTQLKRFQSIIQKAEKKGIQFRYIHCSNSGALLTLPKSRFNMLRVGLLLYGVYPSDEVPQTIPVKPVMDFKGIVVELRKIEAGTPVSYGGIWTSKKETHIGVVQAGFADGVPRPWFEKGSVGYNGKQYPVAGRICMDQLTVDFGNDPVIIGDEVLIWGEDEKTRISVEEISKEISSTPYVIFTGLGNRVKKIPV
jgi:alanine racemase